MSGGGLLNFGFVRADKTTSREEIEALKIARSVQEAIDLERIKVHRDKSEEASLRITVRGKKVSTSKEAMRKRIERRRNKLRAAMSDDFAAASRAISPDSDDDVETERSAQVISADDDDDVVEREPHYVDNQGREMKRKPTRAALPAWGVVTAGGSRKWQPTERALVIEQHQKLNITGACVYARTAVVLQRRQCCGLLI